MSVAAATELVTAALVSGGYSGEEAAVIGDHLVDCELRGISYGGLARGLSVLERVRGQVAAWQPMTVVRETPVSVTLDGEDEVGYLVASRATELALGKDGTAGIAVVGAHNSWYTGMFSYYLERVAAAGYVGMVAGSGAHIVAPHGANEARFATNPIAFGFPTTGQPVIWDIGTSETTLAEVMLAHRLGRPLPEGRLFDRQGSPSTAPLDLLGGALTVWGGHRGFGLALVVQMLGALAGASYTPQGLSDCGFLLVVIDPATLTDADDFCRRTSAYADSVRAARPLDPDAPVRMPFDRSVGTASTALHRCPCPSRRTGRRPRTRVSSTPSRRHQLAPAERHRPHPHQQLALAPGRRPRPGDARARSPPPQLASAPPPVARRMPHHLLPEDRPRDSADAPGGHPGMLVGSRRPVTVVVVSRRRRARPTSAAGCRPRSR